MANRPETEARHPEDSMASGHARHGGNLRELTQRSGLDREAILDCSANLNPLGPPDWLDACLIAGRRKLTEYPDPDMRDLRLAAATALGVPAGSLVFGNGADELIFALARVLHALSGGPQYFLEPGYASYREAALRSGAVITGFRAVDLAAAVAGAPRDSVFWLGCPNNPDGWLPDEYPHSLASLAKARPDCHFVLDEAFIDFVDGDRRGHASAIELCTRNPNLVVLRSLTKFWCVPGLRVGYCCWPAGAEQLRAELPNWPLNAIAEDFALRCFRDPQRGERRDATLQLLGQERERLGKAFASLPDCIYLPGAANFYLVAFPSGKYPDLIGNLLRQGVAVRDCANFAGLSAGVPAGVTESSAAAIQEPVGYIRLAIRTPEENDRVSEAFARAASQDGAGTGGPAQSRLATGTANDTATEDTLPPPARRRDRRAAAIMVQGCSSNAGKSLITAALCRIFRNAGWDVAPYKAQNMSLNSAVTADGLELGRAQAVQAAACGLPADTRMNPVLLKPESDRGSQVVLLGKPHARYQAKQYYELHTTMRETARRAYDELAAEHELVILEGAGSPAEINLKTRDFVNMGAARHAGARVLLVGDIDRGGVFASFIGTVSTFSPEELRLFSGFLVNKFRGDPELLGDAFAMTRDRTGYPVLGCVPMIGDLMIPDEDQPLVRAPDRTGVELRIAVPKLRRVSNFTDLDAFAADPDVAIVPVASAAEFWTAKPDAVLIPGSKSTVADLDWLRSSGLAEAIGRFAASGGSVVGICGGYQMLGRLILDPEGTESERRETPGLALLPLVTSFHADKTLVRADALWLPEGFALQGYEIHHGQTKPLSGQHAGVAAEAPGGLRPVMRRADGEILGYSAGNCWGSYLHGLFDNDEFRRYFINGLRHRKGLPPLPVFRQPGLDAELDRLAAAVQAAVDWPAIEALAGKRR